MTIQQKFTLDNLFFGSLNWLVFGFASCLVWHSWINLCMQIKFSPCISLYWSFEIRNYMQYTQFTSVIYWNYRGADSCDELLILSLHMLHVPGTVKSQQILISVCQTNFYWRKEYSEKIKIHECFLNLNIFFFFMIDIKKNL